MIDIIESRNRTTVRAVSTTAEESSLGPAMKPPGPTKYTKKSNRTREDIANKSAKAAIKA